MPVDHSLSLREAIVAHLAADATVAAIVGSRVYGPQAPAAPRWPFLRYGLPVTVPFEATCWDGSEGTVTIHAFAHGPGEDACATLAKAVVASLNDQPISFEGFGDLTLVSCDWTRTQVVRDTDEAGAFHAIIDFTAQTAEPD